MVGTRFRIGISDPFDLGEFLRWQPLFAVCEGFQEAGAGSALLTLETEFVYRDVQCRYFIVNPRHVGVLLIAVLTSPVNVGGTRISAEAAKSDRPFDLSGWRGGVAFIGTLKVE